jgi:hypothetical protein
MAVTLKPKKGCCKSNPRCKRCPVVCKRLVKQGLAEQRSNGIVVLLAGVSKKQIKLARKR